MRSFARSMASVAVAGLVVPPRPSSVRGSTLAARSVPGALRAFWLDGLFTAGQDAVIAAYLPLLAAALGASATQVGILAAAQSLGALLALYPGALAARNVKSRRRFVIVNMGIVSRFALLAAAFVIAFSSGALALWLVIALFMARSFLMAFSQPAWTALAADFVPAGLRARFFASRGFAVSLAMLVVTPLGGVILDRAGTPNGYVISLLVAFALGMAATVCYSSIPERAAGSQVARGGEGAHLSFARLRRSGPFRRLLLASVVMQFGTMLAGPFFNVYLIHDLGGTNTLVGLVSTASIAAGLIGQLFFGEALVRSGPARVLALSLVAMPLIPLTWAVIDAPWLAVVPNVAGGVAWAGFNLASFQILIESGPPDEREQLVALYHTCVFAALFIAPFAGGALAEAAGYQACFVVSAAVRGAAALVFVGRVPGVDLRGAARRFAIARTP